MESKLSRTVVVLAFVFHLVVGFFYLFTGLLAPVPVAIALQIVWLGLLVVAIRVRAQPKRVALVPVVAAVLWFAVVNIGSAVFGWTA